MHAHAPKRNTHVRAEAADLALWRSPIQSSCSPGVSLNVSPSPDWPYLAAGVRFSQYREESLIGREEEKRREKVAEEGKTQAFSFFSFRFFSSPKNTQKRFCSPHHFFFHWSEEVRKGPRFTWVATHPEKQRRFSFVFIASHGGGGGDMFFSFLFLLIGWTASHELVCVCVGGGTRGSLLSKKKSASVLRISVPPPPPPPPSVSLVSLLRISRSALVWFEARAPPLEALMQLWNAHADATKKKKKKPASSALGRWWCATQCYATHLRPSVASELYATWTWFATQSS